MAKKAKRPNARALAKQAAAYLFSGYNGFQVDRLVQVDKENRPAGGWAESAVVDAIESYLRIYARQVLRDRKRREQANG